jgi:hypothetical protein
MNNVTDVLAIAEKYLSEMLEADRTTDYAAFIERFDGIGLDGFNEDVFRSDVEHMREDLGAYKERFYLGFLQGFKNKLHAKCLRFVWRAVYEKNEALIVLGMHEKNGTWYVNESTVSK